VILSSMADSPEREEARRYADDKLGMAIQIQARVSTTRPASDSRRLLEAGERQERDVLAACFAFPQLLGELEKLSPDHFDSADNRALREALLRGDAGPATAELDAVAAADAIDEATGNELLLRLRERHLRRQLARVDVQQQRELQKQLLEIRAELTL
jgi:hypothetical protein